MGLHGGNIKEAARKYRLRQDEIIDFSASINPLGPPLNLKKIVLDNLDSLQFYPDPDCSDLKMALAQYSGAPENNILCGNGSAELIYLITLALKPKRVVIPLPAFSEYERAAAMAGTRCKFIKTDERNGFKINAGEILKGVSRADLVFICNPNNPTGFLFDEKTVISLAKECENKGIFLVIDEVFIDFVAGVSRACLLKLVSKSKQIIVLRSLTKFFAISGLRLGYLIAGKELIKRISFYQPPWSVNTLAQAAGYCLLKDKGFIRRSRQYMFEERKNLFAELAKIKYLKPYLPSANFIFCKIINKKINSARIFDYCAKKGAIIRDCANFRMLNHSFIRIAVRKKEENARLISILKGLEQV